MFYVNSITSYKFNGIPLNDANISKKIFNYNNFIDSNLSTKNADIDNLNIITVNGLYGYRTGIIGWISNLCSLYLSKKNNPTLLQRFLNYMIKDDDKKILSNDFETVSYFLSLVNRCIPIINYGNWDPKSFLCTNETEIKNLSFPTIYNFNSLYLLSPLYDSGCAIYSNKLPNYYGFKKWTIWNNINFDDKKFNKGMAWAFYKNNNNGIIIINLCLHNSDTCLLYNMQMQQIVKFKKYLEENFCKDLNSYETYITGDFKSEFNSLSDIELQSRVNILKEANLELISNSTDTSTTHFIFYSSYNHTPTPKKRTLLSNVDMLDSEFININNEVINEVEVVIENKIFEDKNEVVIENKIFQDKNELVIENENKVVFEDINEVEIVNELKNNNIILNYFTVEKTPKENEEESNIKSEWHFL